MKLFHYVANCTEAFDPRTGDGLFNLFENVSEFARLEDDFRELIENGDTDFLTRDDFESLADIADIPDFLTDKELQFYNFEGNETRPEILGAYDINADIHYFFAK